MSRSLYVVLFVLLPLLLEAQNLQYCGITCTGTCTDTNCQCLAGGCYCSSCDSASGQNCVDLHAPGRVSDCPSREYLCQDPLYKELMKYQCPKTCGYCN
ncbi:hypothetical protein QR680_000738 [Steinernema hermaphroditum]|uniref:ShKT domain-containing protein n=1 Tax=Steinernema hermaphroditum TaxID=289476 RepID=A0AA39LEM3_9BILA|nr:hypothetical protein QR680_000738 [Steinernema hermaphroditum]